MFGRLLLVVFSLLAVSFATGQLTPQERKGIEQALYLGNMTLRDLEWARDMRASTGTLPIYRLSLTQPLESADKLMGVHGQGLTGDSAALLGWIRTELAGEAAAPDSKPAPSSWKAEWLPATLRQPVRDLIGLVGLANSEIKASLEPLSAEERRMLVEGLPKLAAGQELKLDFTRGTPPDTGKLLEALAKVDLARIRRASAAMSAGVSEVLPRLRAAAEKTQYFTGWVRERVDGMIVVVAGHGNDVHRDRDASLTIDLGGYDQYRGRHGAGILAASLLIDLRGNDTYDGWDLSIGSGILGCGAAYDLAGNDTYRGGSILYGAGIAGSGSLFNLGGDDTYQAASMSQGFGMFGVGLCLDSEGRDRYQVGYLGQGAARSGGVGWLIDRAGDDTYRAGGLVRNPRFAEAFVSASQGYSSGYEAEGLNGGIGLLSEGAGDDVYLAGTHAQASSQTHGVGTLFDGSGSDTYMAHHYAQGCALDSSGSFLMDLSGDDGYFVRQGASHGLGHNYGVALVLDRAGNDQFTSSSSRPGSGNAGGLGVFVDAEGEDKYAGSPGFGGLSGAGAVGVFVDGSGLDTYAASIAEGGAEVRGGWSVSLDLDPPATDTAPPPTLDANPTPGSVPLPPDAEMERLYVGLTKRDPASLTRLRAIGEPAVGWIVERKSERIGATGVAGLAELARHTAASRALLSQAMPKWISRPETSRAAARVAGELGLGEAAPALLVLAASEDRVAAREAVAALAAIGDRQATGTARVLLNSPDLMVRRAARDLMARFPDEAVATARQLMEGDERQARTGLELLGRCGDPGAIALIGQALSDSRPGVRLQALVELDGRVPVSLHGKVQALRDDSSRLVRAVAQRVRL